MATKWKTPWHQHYRGTRLQGHHHCGKGMPKSDMECSERAIKELCEALILMQLMGAENSVDNGVVALEDARYILSYSGIHWP